ncbi:MAG: hypothetical protein ABS69_05325 [Nitrosomonadales bacterium SCN 54-20]|nr:MAG: hypothetical protein ABS69_05325 [Nitrosomonadales bacterium SCN 54-20]
MSLADLIRGKKALDKFATATPATFATPKPEERRTVATVAGVAVAIPADSIPETPVKVETSDTATASHWWRFHYSNREPKEASYWPTLNEAEALEGELDAISAEPFEPTRRQPDEPLSEDEEIEIREWLTYIGESDEAMIAVALEQCRTDADARDAFLRMAREKK